MILKRLLIIAAFWSCFLAAQAQDIHFTQFYMSPLTLNPAQTGGFLGTFRIGGIYRDQQNYIAGIKGYTTPSLYIDAPLVRGFRKSDWVGAGISLVQDQAGTGKLTNGNVGISAAYHLALNKKQTSVLAIGGQVGFAQRRIGDRDALIFEDHILDATSNIDAGKLAQDKVSYTDFSVGVGLTSALNKKNALNVGFTVGHITKPKYSLFTSSTDKRAMRLNGHAQLVMDINDKWMLTPAVLFQNSAAQNEIALQAVAGYKLKPDVTLRFGPGYRFADAAKIILGLDYKQFRAGLSYDINISDLALATGGHGGFEIAASYIAKIYKKPVVKPVIFCPKF